MALFADVANRVGMNKLNMARYSDNTISPPTANTAGPSGGNIVNGAFIPNTYRPSPTRQVVAGTNQPNIFGYAGTDFASLLNTVGRTKLSNVPVTVRSRGTQNVLDTLAGVPIIGGVFSRLNRSHYNPLSGTITLTPRADWQTAEEEAIHALDQWAPTFGQRMRNWMQPTFYSQLRSDQLTFFDYGSPLTPAAREREIVPAVWDWARASTGDYQERPLELFSIPAAQQWFSQYFKWNAIDPG